MRDEYSRYLLELRRLTDAKTETVRLCFERLFEAHGLPAATPEPAMWLTLGSFLVVAVWAKRRMNQASSISA